MFRKVVHNMLSPLVVLVVLIIVTVLAGYFAPGILIDDNLHKYSSDQQAFIKNVSASFTSPATLQIQVLEVRVLDKPESCDAGSSQYQATWKNFTFFGIETGTTTATMCRASI